LIVQPDVPQKQSLFFIYRNIGANVGGHLLAEINDRGGKINNVYKTTDFKKKPT